MCGMMISTLIPLCFLQLMRGLLLSSSINLMNPTFSLYAPTSGKDDEFLDCLGFLEEFLWNNIPNCGSVLIGMDSNCSDKSSSRRKLAWSNFCKTYSFEMKITGLPAFHHNNGSSESCIDYFVLQFYKVENLKQICTWTYH